MNLKEVYAVLEINYCRERFLDLRGIEKKYEKCVNQYHLVMKSKEPELIKKLTKEKFEIFTEAMLVIMESYDDEEIVGIPRTKNWQEERKKLRQKRLEELQRTEKEKKQELEKAQRLYEIEQERKRKEEEKNRIKEEMKKREEIKRQEKLKKLEKEEEKRKKELFIQDIKKDIKENKFKILLGLSPLIFSFTLICIGVKREFDLENKKATIYQSTQLNKKIETKKSVYKIKDGTYKTTYKNGNVETFIYKNGIKEGPAKYVYNNGDIEEYIYAKGRKKGPAKYKYQNGDIEEYTYKNGVKDGFAKYKVYEDGIEEYSYVNGKAYSY